MTSYLDHDVINMIHFDRKWTQASCAVILIPIKALWTDFIPISHFVTWQKCRKRDDHMVSHVRDHAQSIPRTLFTLGTKFQNWILLSFWVAIFGNVSKILSWDRYTWHYKFFPTKSFPTTIFPTTLSNYTWPSITSLMRTVLSGIWQ